MPDTFTIKLFRFQLIRECQMNDSWLNWINGNLLRKYIRDYSVETLWLPTFGIFWFVTHHQLYRVYYTRSTCKLSKLKDKSKNYCILHIYHCIWAARITAVPFHMKREEYGCDRWVSHSRCETRTIYWSFDMPDKMVPKNITERRKP